jgi:hypothetical protein
MMTSSERARMAYSLGFEKITRVSLGVVQFCPKRLSGGAPLPAARTGYEGGTRPESASACTKAQYIRIYAPLNTFSIKIATRPLDLVKFCTIIRE